MKNKFLIISPHLDDAVLSCGASMAQWQEEGAEVIVASIFTSCAEYNEKMNAVYQNRRKQDIEALSFLAGLCILLSTSGWLCWKGISKYGSILLSAIRGIILVTFG